MQQCVHEDPIPFPQSSPPPTHAQPANDPSSNDNTSTPHEHPVTGTQSASSSSSSNTHTSTMTTATSTTTRTTDDRQPTTSNDSLHSAQPTNEQTVHDSASTPCTTSTANPSTLRPTHSEPLPSSHTDTGHDTLPHSTDVASDSNLAHTVSTQHHHQHEPEQAGSTGTAMSDEINENTLILSNKNDDEYRKYRVKVYTLTEDGNWADEGTGHCQFELITNSTPQDEQHAIDIRVLSETDSQSLQTHHHDDILLHHIATKDVLYDKQGDSIIQWIDSSPSSETMSSSTERRHQLERAVSFQHPEQCVSVWRLIAFIKGHRSMSEFEAQIKRYRGNKSSSDHQLTELDHSDEIHTNTAKSDRKRVRLDSSSDDDEDDDDVRMKHKKRKCGHDSNELLSTFFNDHNEQDSDDEDDDDDDEDGGNDNELQRGKQRNGNVRDEEEEEGAEGEDDDDIDINVNKDICIKSENKSPTKKKKLRFKNRKKSKKKKKKQKNAKKKKLNKSSYFDRDHRTHKDEEDEEESNVHRNEPESDDSNYSDQRESMSSSDDDDDDDGTAFLNKLTMKTHKKQKKRKLQIPMPTQHNLCEVYSRVKNSIENKNISAINQLANPDWINQLFDVFTALEHNEINRRQQRMQTIPEQQHLTESTMDVDRAVLDSLPTVTSISTVNEKTEQSSQTEPESKSSTLPLDRLTVPSSDIHGDAHNKEQHTDLSSPLKSSIPKPPVLTPRLSTASLSTLPPSVEEDDNERFHALEFIFLIVLECCRDTTSIKRRKPSHSDKKRSSVQSKFDHIGDGGGCFSMPSFMSFFNSFNGGRSNTMPLCMVYLGKQFLDKTIAMLEYDPVRRIQTEHTSSCSLFGPASSTANATSKTPDLSCSSLLSVRSVTPSPAKPLTVSTKHRDYLKKAKATKLIDIPFTDGYDLYEEIEHLYKLTYIRDVVLLGKLDLEQQAWHVLNHHIMRYNQIICEAVAEDSTFLRTLFFKIKQSCSTHYGIVPPEQLKTVDVNHDSLTPDDSTPVLTPRFADNDKENNQDEDKKQDDNTIKDEAEDVAPNGDQPLLARSMSRTVSIEDDSSSSSRSGSNHAANKELPRTDSQPLKANGHSDVDNKMETDSNHNINHRQQDVNQEEGEEDDTDTEYRQEMKRRLLNRRELFSAPDGVLFRFLSELLFRSKMIADPPARSSVFANFVSNGLIETLTICVQNDRVLPTKQFSHIWLVLVESLHHMLSISPYGQAPQIRAEICKQIGYKSIEEDFETNTPKTLLQKLCSVFCADYVCDDVGVLDQIYYVITGILGLGELMGLDGQSALLYNGVGANKSLQSEQLSKISNHFFEDCVPLFYRVLSRSHRYTAYHGRNQNNNRNGNAADTPSYQQIKTIQKYVINLLSACCEQEQFIQKLKDIEQKYDIMSSIHNLIYVPKDGSLAEEEKNDHMDDQQQQRRHRRRRSVPNVDLTLCCVRFLRECINLAQHDKFWAERVRNYGLFKNILGIFNYNGLNRYNMLNSTILSIFACIEEKKIEDIILYLGDEQILSTYSKKINYTSKFEELLELYDKIKSGISISTQIDDGSTATLSNCSSMSPRMSPNNGLLHGSAWSNEAEKDEIHYFDNDEEEDQDGDDDVDRAHYSLDDGPNHNHSRAQHDEKDQEEEEVPDLERTARTKHNGMNGSRQQQDERQDTDLSQNNNNNHNDSHHAKITPPFKHRNGDHPVHKDSPRPIFGTHFVSTELALPNRQKQEAELDLLTNANNMARKRADKKKSLNMFDRLRVKQKQQRNHQQAEDDEHADKESSPFLDTVSNAMSTSQQSHGSANRKSSKRKFKDISNDSSQSQSQSQSQNENVPVTTTSSYIASKFEAVELMSSTDGVHQEIAEIAPPKKKFKLSLNHDHGRKAFNESPDTFEAADASQTNNSINVHDVPMSMDGDDIQYVNHNGNGEHSHHSNHNHHSQTNGYGSILLNGDDSNHSVHSQSPKSVKHVRFEQDEGTADIDMSALIKSRQIENQKDKEMEKENGRESVISNSSNCELSPSPHSTAICQT